MYVPNNYDVYFANFNINVDTGNCKNIRKYTDNRLPLIDIEVSSQRKTSEAN